MYSHSYGISIVGIEGYVISVEVDVSDGLPIFELVGYLGSEVKEGKERVRIAIKNSGYALGPKRITVNLSPADIRKEGTSYDVSIAMGVLSCFGLVNKELIEDKIFIGELSLSGEVRSVHGVLPMVYTARMNGFKTCYVPYDNKEEASMVDGIIVYGVRYLKEVLDHINKKNLVLHEECLKETVNDGNNMDFSDVAGQVIAKRAIEVATAGMHNILLVGTPGSGKTMLASRIPSITPPLTTIEMLEISKIYSVAGLLNQKKALVTTRPFRSPHHTITSQALTGGGRTPRPGEISLSHRGVLFLDEFPEFQRNTIEVLRQPLEEKHVTIARVNGTITYPSDIQLVAAMNPCPCGYYPDRNRCNCTTPQINKYLQRISRPILDRIDICTETEVITYDSLCEKNLEETSYEILQRVIKAREIQLERYKEDGILYNSQLTNKLIEKYCILGSGVESLLKRAFEMYGLSARAYHRILKVARTIADLECSINIEESHISEAIFYRSIDKKYWGNEYGQ